MYFIISSKGTLDSFLKQILGKKTNKKNGRLYELHCKLNLTIFNTFNSTSVEKNTE